uniref:Apple domain-containing protein n=1 Tax=Anguilla anguilla TaxID=7936 RepID=A0A0E9X3V9_ANGAN
MRVSLVLLCLVLLWGDSLSEECVRELQVDVDFPGSDVQQILSPDAHHCQLACTQHHHCLFFTFVRPEWTRDKRQFFCYLKHTDSGKPAKITSLSGVTSGYSMKTCKDRSPQTCLSTVYKNVDFTGADYTSLFTADYEDCQSTCTKDPDCQFFSFLNQDFPTSKYRNKCFLKHRRVFPSPPRVNSLNGVASGFSHKICTAAALMEKIASTRFRPMWIFLGMTLSRFHLPRLNTATFYAPSTPAAPSIHMQGKRCFAT